MKTQDFLGNEWEYDCMGCAISNGSMAVPGEMIATTENFYVHQDPLIPLSGFLVIAARRHYQSLAEMEVSEYQEFSSLVQRTHQAIKQILGVASLTIVQEESARHFHLWFFPWTDEVMERYGKPSLTKVRDIMSDYRQEKISQVAWLELKGSIEQIRTIMERM